MSCPLTDMKLFHQVTAQAAEPLFCFRQSACFHKFCQTVDPIRTASDICKALPCVFRVHGFLLSMSFSEDIYIIAPCRNLR